MFSVMFCLENWKNYDKEEKNKTFHRASIDKIINTLKSNVKNLNDNKILSIIDFLELKDGEVTKTIENNKMKENNNIPIWEHTKRIARYSIKPLIKNENAYYWGCCSVYKTRTIWEKHLFSFTFPYQCDNYPNIKQYLEYWEEKVQKHIVEKSLNIAKNYTEFIIKEIELHKIDKNGEHPIELGDYDLLIFLDKVNILLNVECKYIRDSYCIKDAKRDIEKIFYGKDRNGKSYISKLMKRQEYLEKNYLRVLKKIKWINNDIELKIIPIFLLKELTFFTMFPKEKTNVTFLDVTNFNEYLQELIK